MGLSTIEILFFTILIIVSLGLNVLVIIGMLKKPSGTSLRDIILISLAVSDFTNTALGYSAELFGRVFGNSLLVCQLAGFAMTFTAITSISHLVSLAVERYLCLVYAFQFHDFFGIKKHVVYFILPAWFHGFMWSVIPFSGWSGYVREPIDTWRCSVILADTSFSSRSFGCCLFAFCYCIPLLVILFCCFKVQVELRNMTQRAAEILGEQSSITGQTTKAERQHSLMIGVVFLSFFTTWSPYAICVIYGTVVGSAPPTLITYSALFAKFSVMFNPIIYAIFYKDFRKGIRSILCRSNVIHVEWVISVEKRWILTNTAVS